MSCRAALWEPNVERKPPRGGEAWPGSAGRHLLSAKAKSALRARRVSWLGRPSAIADGRPYSCGTAPDFREPFSRAPASPWRPPHPGGRPPRPEYFSCGSSIGSGLEPVKRRVRRRLPPSPRKTVLLHVEEIGRGESRPQTRASSTARLDHPCARRGRCASSLVEDSVVTDTARSRGWMNPEDARRLRRLTDLPSRDTSHGNSSRSMQHVSKRSW